LRIAHIRQIEAIEVVLGLEGKVEVADGMGVLVDASLVATLVLQDTVFRGLLYDLGLNLTRSAVTEREDAALADTHGAHVQISLHAHRPLTTVVGPGLCRESTRRRGLGGDVVGVLIPAVSRRQFAGCGLIVEAHKDEGNPIGLLTRKHPQQIVAV